MARSTGILTENLREHVRGEKDYNTRQARSNAKSELQSRIRNAIIDLGFLNEHLDHNQFVEALEQDKQARHRAAPPGMTPDERPDAAVELLGERWVTRVEPEVFENYVEVVVFLYRIAGLNGLRHFVKQGVEEIYDRYRDDAILESVTFRWDARLKENLVKVGRQKMAQEEPLPRAVREAMMESDEYSAEEIGRYVDEHPREEDTPFGESLEEWLESEGW